MWTRAWWTAAAERALKTMAQTLVALIGANAVDVTALDWPSLLGIAATAGDGAVSAEAVKSRIKALIDAEDAKAILSDEAIAQKLAAEGHDIARRTVVKYREAMGYGSSVQRRRQVAAI